MKSTLDKKQNFGEQITLNTNNKIIQFDFVKFV